MGGSSKLLMLLTSPFPLLYSLSALRLTRHPRITISAFSSFPFSKRRISSSTTRPILPFSTHQNSERLHTQTARVIREEFHAETTGFSPKVSHPWPEWSKLVENLRGNGYFNSQAGLDGEDALSVFENLPEEFLRSAAACLAFARHRSDLLGSLSRKDIEVVVGNGSPFLFKSSLDSARRMKSFLGGDQNNELEFERAYTVDLMRFLLSYVYDPSVVSDGNNLGNGQLVESSVRNLLNEMADPSRAAQEFGLSSPQQFTDGYGQSTRPVRPNIEMKRGDWICPKCSFMNFARNLKCLECNEARPKRQLTGGEWECPQCDFFNYGRNVMCLRCDCKRPGEASFGTVESRSTLGYSNESNLNKGDIPNTRMTSQFQGNLGHDGTFQRNNFRSVDGVSPGKNTGNTPMTQSLDRILGRRSPASEMSYNATTAGANTTGNERSSFSGSSSPPIRHSDGTKSDYVPFVPLPADMFAKPQKSMEQEQPVTGNTNSAELKSSGSGHGKSGDSFQLSEKPVNQAESKENKEQAEKSERWFKKVSELHDVTDLTSAISDEDFPEIMPMRKGENRFVVSKKKDRSLTSPLNKRRMAMEQTNSTNFVPFVPFPPDYFAKKDKEPQTGVASTPSETQNAPQKSEEHKIVSPDSEGTRYPPQSTDNRQTNENSWNTSFSRTSGNESKTDYGYARNSSERPNDLRTTNEGCWNSSSSSSPIVSSAQQFENTQNTRDSWKGGFTGKSLEGSLVKEPDPLDMSEEAKAERWFRRAAQIKDISELSQIPDEDFPQIMPMRKGVNRFVVSKRKTPLERRLTSPQYRRNLPIVSSEPVKKENNES